MKLLAILLVYVPSILATQHTQCFNYFLAKDGCVTAAADDRYRCPRKIHHLHRAVDHSATVIRPPHSKGHEKNNLHKRYDTNEKSFFIAGGTGACGEYDTNDRKGGVCLWVGTNHQDGSDPKTAGWLNPAKASNCGNQVYIIRKGRPAIYAPVVDACTFDTKVVADGCFRIAFTNRTFHDLGPTQDEINDGFLKGVSWDFNNDGGERTQDAPV